MNEDLSRKIKADLEKSGFAAEMEAARIAHSAGWQFFPGQSFIDPDSGKHRDLDLVVRKCKMGGDQYFIFDYSLIVEVKKSTKPWVVMSRPHTGHVGSFPVVSGNLARPWDERMPLKRDGVADELGWFGYGVHEAFKDPKQPSRWYEAAITACEAAGHNAASHYPEDRVPHPEADYEFKASTFDERAELTIYKPVIVLDGTLVRASLDSEGDFDLDEVGFASTRIHLKNRGVGGYTHSVDVVTLGSWSEYLNRSDMEFSALANWMDRNTVAPNPREA